MPNYSYACQECGGRFRKSMSYAEFDQAVVRCPHCGGTKLARRLGRVRFARASESRLEAMSDPQALAGLEDDPRALGRMMRQMGREYGDELGGTAEQAEFNEVVDRLEAGQSPEQIEKDLPDLGSEL